MHPRQGLIELFSMFLIFEGDRPQRWHMDPRLRRSMERCLAANPSPADPSPADPSPADPSQAANFWALYWHHHWHHHWTSSEKGLGDPRSGSPNPFSGELYQPTPSQPPQAFQPQALAQAHLAAYVQDSCYWAAETTARQLQSSNTSLADCFQIAIAQLHKVLRGYNPLQGTNFATYAQITFKSLIRETLRQTKEIDICTDWALLRKTTRKRLGEALTAAGLNADSRDRHLLTWTHFKTLYVPQQATATRALTQPDRATLQAIAQACQGDRLTNLTPTQIEQTLLLSAQYLRRYLYPKPILPSTSPSLDDPFSIETLADKTTPSPMATLLEQEANRDRQQQQQALRAVLLKALSALNPDDQALLRYYYRDNLTQQDMAERLGIKQYTVSRRLTKLRETLIKTLVTWSQQQLHTPPTPDLLKATSTLLEEWLLKNYEV